MEQTSGRLLRFHSVFILIAALPKHLSVYQSVPMGERVLIFPYNSSQLCCRVKLVYNLVIALILFLIVILLYLKAYYLILSYCILFVGMLC